MALDFPSSPTNGQTYTANNITWVYETSSTTWKVKQDGTAGKTRIASVKDIKGPAADGGAIAAETWTTRDLNTISDVGNIGITVTDNKISVPAGTYKITWRAPGWRIYTFKTKLEYSTDSTFASGVTKVIGSSEYSSTVGTDGQNSQSNSVGLVPSVTFTETTYVRIRQWSAVAKSSPDNGLGVATVNNLVIPNTNSDEDNVFTLVEIEDLATAVKDNAVYVEGTSKVALLKDEKDEGVAGGSFQQGAWKDRNLTVEEDPQNFVNFTAGGTSSAGTQNQPGYWSLPAGTYLIEWSAPAHNVTKHQSLLVYSTTSSHISTAGLDGSASYVEGSSEDITAGGSGGDQSISIGSKVITTATTTWFKIMHRCEVDAFGEGMGQDTPGWGTKEIYTQVRITDLETAVKNSESMNSSTNVWHVQKTDNQTIDNETWTDITSLSQTVTSTSSSTKFLITATVNGSMSNNSGHDGLLRLMRGTTVIGSTSTEGSATANNTGFAQVSGQDSYYTIDNGCITFLDTPGVGSHTYHIEGRNTDDSSNLIINGRTAGGYFMVSHMSIQRYT